MPHNGSWEEGGELFSAFPDRATYRTNAPRWAPPMDVYETNEQIVIVTEIPGIKEEDIRVCFTNNVITISGVKRKITSESCASYYCVERYHGEFRRSFRINADVDREGMDASYEAGILTIIIPKNKSGKGGAK